MPEESVLLQFIRLAKTSPTYRQFSLGEDKFPRVSVSRYLVTTPNFELPEDGENYYNQGKRRF